MPGDNKIVAHLKDKNKIRHRKRWSQIMYMYYLLGYKLVGRLDFTNTMFSSRDSSTSDKEKKSRFYRGHLVYSFYEIVIYNFGPVL